MKAKLAVSVCIILLTIMLFIPYTYAADNNVGIEVTFNKSSYVTGETASAIITLTGLNDEKTDGIKLGAFETHLNFDNSKLEYITGGYNDSLSEKLTSANTEKGFQVTEKFNNVIVAFFNCPDGVALSDVDANGNLIIGTASFKVKASKGDTIETSFDTAYTNVVTKPFGTADKGESLNCTAGEKATAKIVDGVIEAPTAVFDNNIVSGSVNVRLPESESGVLLAVLRDKTSGLVKKSNIKTIDSSNTINVSFEGITNNSNLKIDYYLWKSLFSMKAIAENVSAEVTTGN